MGSNRWVAIAVVPLLVLSLAVMALAQAAPPPTAADVAAQTQSRLLAKRAAMADGYRNLAEQVKGLRITSTTFVKDFVAESDDIATAVNTFLRGAKLVGEPRYMEDNSCEVTMELPLLTVETELTRIYRANYKGDKYKINDFRDLHVTNKIEKVTVKGNGAPRAIAVEEFDDAGKPVVQPGVPLALPPEWKNIPPQGRLMARRAALVDAYRNLAEQVKGLRINSTTFVRDFVAENDQIQTDLNTFLKGAKEAEVRYLRDLSVEVDVKVALQTVITELTREYEAHYKGDKYKIRDFENIKQEVKIDWVTATGNGVVPAKYLGVTPPVGPGPVVNVPDWVKNTVKATGNGVKPTNVETEAQAKLMALRAAKVDAMRNLSEQINGLKIDATTQVKDFVTQNDQIVTEINDYLKGVKTVSEDYNPATGEAKVVVETPLEPLWDLVVKYRKTVTIERRVQ